MSTKIPVLVARILPVMKQFRNATYSVERKNAEGTTETVQRPLDQRHLAFLSSYEEGKSAADIARDIVTELDGAVSVKSFRGANSSGAVGALRDALNEVFAGLGLPVIELERKARTNSPEAVAKRNIAWDSAFATWSALANEDSDEEDSGNMDETN
jgi:hypothetical protein